MTLDLELLKIHVDKLINSLWKIVPIHETYPDTVTKYIDNQIRMIMGFKELFASGVNVGYLVEVVSILNYYSTESGNTYGKTALKQDISKAIELLKKMAKEVE